MIQHNKLERKSRQIVTRFDCPKASNSINICQKILFLYYRLLT